MILLTNSLFNMSSEQQFMLIINVTYNSILLDKRIVC